MNDKTKHLSLTAREIGEQETEAGLRIRNAIFPPITLEDWRRASPATGALALHGDEPVGFIPMLLRRFRIAPGIVLTAAFENAVGTREDMRGQGVGSLMIDSAKHFLKGKADLLMVYRGGERSQGYHFYAKTGHVDLCYTRVYRTGGRTGSFTHPGEMTVSPVTVTKGSEPIVADSARLLELFEQTYETYGGFPDRDLDYWSRAFRSSYYAGRPHDWFWFLLREDGRLTGSVIAGKERSRDGWETHFKILEMAAAGGDAERVKILLQTAMAYAERQGLGPFVLEAGDFSPFRELFGYLGLEMGRRGLITMGLSYDSPALFEKLWKPKLRLPGVELKVWTPEQEFTLLPALSPDDRTILLEMKEETLTRWLMGRLDIKARVREGTVTVVNGNSAVVEELGRAIPHVHWDYHALDYC